jgi:drug/metabolite transporter (DMT)-like permease
LAVTPLSHRNAHLLMHVTVLVWGVTAILGRMISLPADQLVSYRLLIVVITMALYARLKRHSFTVSKPIALRLALAGVFVGLHWLLFYGCIKSAGIAVAVLCLSSNSLFTALFEPIVFGSRLSRIELMFGAFVMVGVAILVKVETHGGALGLSLGIGSALFSAAFGTMNGRLARELPAPIMTTYELAIALVLTLSVVAVRASQGIPVVWPLALSLADALLLSALAIVCTVLPWLWSLRILQTLRPYAMSLAVSLETVYAMALAWFLFPSAERLTWRFYLGSGLLLLLVVLNTMRKGGRSATA